MNNVNFLKDNHEVTNRDYIERMSNEKVHCMEVASKYDINYWDGDRKYGYGGYRYDGRWNKVAKKIIKFYELTKDSKILDIGCGKAHLIFEIKKEIDCEVVGIDISPYAIENSPEEITQSLKVQSALSLDSFKVDEFDLVLSIMTLHNFELFEIEKILENISRISKKAYIAVESYRSNKELFNLQCWALTCSSFLTPKEWAWLFDGSNFKGDSEFLFFQ